MMSGRDGILRDQESMEICVEHDEVMNADEAVHCSASCISRLLAVDLALCCDISRLSRPLRVKTDIFTCDSDFDEQIKHSVNPVARSIINFFSKLFSIGMSSREIN